MHIEIFISKTKNILLLLVGLVFVVISLLLLFFPDMNKAQAYHGQFSIIISLVGFVFFGCTSGILFMKLIDKKPAITINEDGITAVGYGLILWHEIAEINDTMVLQQKFITIKLLNPQDYINKYSHGFKKSALKLNYGLCDTAIMIPTNALQYSHISLLTLLKQQLKNIRLNQLRSPD